MWPRVEFCLNFVTTARASSAWTALTGSNFPAPTPNTKICAEFESACKVKVTRFGGGFGEALTGAANPFEFKTSSWPGNEDATWPSSPRLKITESKPLPINDFANSWS